MHNQGDMLTNVLALLGAQPIMHSSNPNIWVTLWEKDGQACLFLINLFTSPGDVELTLNYQGTAVKIGRMTIDPMTVKVVDL
jgi:hypothetical protein